MKLEVSYTKNGENIMAKIKVIDAGEYYTHQIFEKEYSDEGWEKYFDDFIIKEFPLSEYGLNLAKAWVERMVEEIRIKVKYWCSFELPEPKIIEIDI